MSLSLRKSWNRLLSLVCTEELILDVSRPKGSEESFISTDESFLMNYV